MRLRRKKHLDKRLEICSDLIIYAMENITLDLHNSNFKGNIITEYEQLFSENVSLFTAVKQASEQNRPSW